VVKSLIFKALQRFAVKQSHARPPLETAAKPWEAATGGTPTNDGAALALFATACPRPAPMKSPDLHV